MSALASILRKIPRPVMLVGAVVVVVLVIAVAVALQLTTSAAFLGGYASLEREYMTLQSSGHSSLSCDQCHVGPAGDDVGYRVALVGDFYRGLFSNPDSPAYVKINTPTNEACLSCHADDWSNESSRTVELPHPAHLRVAEESRECVACHKWTAHEEDYIERHKTMPFSGVCASFECHAGWKTVVECGSCHHAVKDEAAEWTVEHKDVVADVGPNACLESCHDADQCRQCHTTGVRPDFPEQGTNAGLKVIEAAHVKPDWMEQHGTFALRDEAACFECHVSVGECESCHAQRPEFHGPKETWLNRHADLADDERRCLTCHEKNWCEECHDKFKEMR